VIVGSVFEPELGEDRSRFVEAQGGTIGYEPGAAGGTIFTISLPRTPDATSSD